MLKSLFRCTLSLPTTVGLADWIRPSKYPESLSFRGSITVEECWSIHGIRRHLYLHIPRYVHGWLNARNAHSCWFWACSQRPIIKNADSCTLWYSAKSNGAFDWFPFKNYWLMLSSKSSEGLQVPWDIDSSLFSQICWQLYIYSCRKAVSYRLTYILTALQL